MKHTIYFLLIFVLISMQFTVHCQAEELFPMPCKKELSVLAVKGSSYKVRIDLYYKVLETDEERLMNSYILFFNPDGCLIVPYIGNGQRLYPSLRILNNDVRIDGFIGEIKSKYFIPNKNHLSNKEFGRSVFFYVFGGVSPAG